MKKLKMMLLALCMSITFAGCQTAARSMGGTTELKLPAGYKLLEVTWKDEANMWYLCRPMREGETPEEYLFRESSEWGIMEGTVKITESEAEDETN